MTSIANAASISNVSTIPATSLISLEKGSILGENISKWNLDITLSVTKKHFQGNWPNHADTTGIKSAIAALFHETEVENVDFTEITATQMSMDFFDRFYHSEPPVVKKESGWISKCLEATRYEICPGVLFCDEIRNCLLNDESDFYYLFKSADRRELMFKLFQLVVVGGMYNQYEDKIGLYLQAVREMYKELVNVVKKDGKISVTSKIYEVRLVKKDDGGSVYFPEKADDVEALHPQSFCLAVVDSDSKTATILKNIWNGQKF